MILMYIFICIAAFAFGFLLGNLNEPDMSNANINTIVKENKTESERIAEEYRNFLDYDGSEQA